MAAVIKFRLNKLSSSEQPISKHTRKPHKKSRNGCGSCKERRLKCDEQRPICGRCKAIQSLCVYAQSAEGHDAKSEGVISLSQSSPSTESILKGSHLAMVQHEVQLDGLLRYSGDEDSMRSNLLLQRMTPYLRVFHHYVNFTLNSLAGPVSQKSMIRTLYLPLALQNSSLMHALLAISAQHMAHLQPNMASHQIARTHHMHRATTLLQQQLARPLGQHNMDLIISNCLSLNMNLIQYDRFDPLDSFVLAEDEAVRARKLQWVEMQASAAQICNVFSDHLHESMWAPAFAESGPEAYHPKTLRELKKEGHEGIPHPLAQLCEIGPDSSSRNNVYHMALRHVSLIFTTGASTSIGTSTIDTFNLIIVFMAQLQPAFRALLGRRDERALLIFVYWLTALYHMDIWWTTGRALNEGHAICMFLENTTSPAIRTLLQYPATQLGYRFSSSITESSSPFESADALSRDQPSPEDELVALSTESLI
ncbi:hypothetical protein PV10_02065 [Exophiala mesophila]|uniref:Zn(2)-C6 fungal-type domain-containing protein n=1 Tax=Exophiala mesophila TaxID=212818 RepID=A0A0D2A5I6_EXOME|nr:uncharacterized protein PV10_02065 [Exophiala mesophila]KIV94283.1 hypothetical protein PV10_02065 [Exophiala mesophila]